MPIFISLGILILLFTQIDFKTGFKTLGQISFYWIIIGFLFFLMAIFFRALRWQLLIKSKKVKVVNLIQITIFHSFFGSLLPARSGELSYIYLLKKRENISVAEGIATLLIARIFDLLIIIISLLITGLILTNILPGFMKLIFIIAIILIFLIILFLIFLTKICKIFFNFIKKTKLSKFNLVSLVLNKSEEIIRNLDIIKSFQTYLFCFIISLISWISLYFVNYFLIKGLAIDLNYFEVIFGTTFVQFITMIPIQGFLNFGTFEAGWTLGFIIIGLNKELTIISGLLIHLLTVLYLLILSGGYWLWSKFRPMNKENFIEVDE